MQQDVAFGARNGKNTVRDANLFGRGEFREPGLHLQEAGGRLGNVVEHGGRRQAVRPDCRPHSKAFFPRNASAGTVRQATSVAQSGARGNTPWLSAL
ncbi:MAG: hypothetical protein Q8R01_07695 [Ramlibacter sp.]|nr:hypothetical protein [Ramlibacter sp.]